MTDRRAPGTDSGGLFRDAVSSAPNVLTWLGFFGLLAGLGLLATGVVVIWASISRAENDELIARFFAFTTIPLALLWVLAAVAIGVVT